MSILTTFFIIVLEVLATAILEEKEGNLYYKRI